MIPITIGLHFCIQHLCFRIY